MIDTHRGGFAIEESAHRLGHYRWASMRLFELLGIWVAEVPENAVKLRLAAASRHHGWHAELIAERLPDVGDLHPDRVTAPASAAVEALFDALGEPTASAPTPERLAGVYRVVVPHLIAVHGWHLGRCTPVADENVSRTLRFMLADEVEDWRFFEGFLQTTIDDSSFDAVNDARARVERLLVASGGISAAATMVDPVDIVGRSSSAPTDADVGG